jgi:hypothetical protein
MNTLRHSTVPTLLQNNCKPLLQALLANSNPKETTLSRVPPVLLPLLPPLRGRSSSSRRNERFQTRSLVPPVPPKVQPRRAQPRKALPRKVQPRKVLLRKVLPRKVRTRRTVLEVDEDEETPATAETAAVKAVAAVAAVTATATATGETPGNLTLVLQRQPAPILGTGCSAPNGAGWPSSSSDDEKDQPPKRPRKPCTPKQARKRALQDFGKLTQSQLNSLATNNVVKNLTSYTPTVWEHAALSLGKGFVPTPNDPSRTELDESLNKFFRNLRLKQLFGGPALQKAPPLRLPNPNFDPRSVNAYYEDPTYRDLERYIKLTRTLFHQALRIVEGKPRKFRSNTSPKIREAITSLREHFTVFVKKSDKGLGLCITARSWYHHESLRQLKDAAVYEEISASNIEKVKLDLQLELNTLLAKDCYKDLLPKTEVTYIKEMFSPKSCKVPRFYLLIKVHKELLAGRPIAAAHSWLTTGASKWLDRYLQPIVLALPTVLNRGTGDVRAQLHRLNLPAGTPVHLATVDVKSFYPSIPHKLGVKATKAAMRATKTYDPDSQLGKFILELLLFVLSNNYVEFDSRFFHQLCGTAMGTNCAVRYANIVGWYLERPVIESFTASQKLGLYGRFVDDGLAVIIGQLQDALEFVKRLNSQHPNITFTSEVSTTSVDFLDLTIFFKDGKLVHKTFFKKFSTFQYGHFSSFHKRSTQAGWLKAELERHIGNNTFEVNFLDHRDFFYGKLRERAFTEHFLSKVFRATTFRANKARILNRDLSGCLDLLQDSGLPNYSVAFARSRRLAAAHSDRSAVSVRFPASELADPAGPASVASAASAAPASVAKNSASEPASVAVFNTHWSRLTKRISFPRLLQTHANLLPPQLQNVRLLVSYSRTANLEESVVFTQDSGNPLTDQLPAATVTGTSLSRTFVNSLSP